MKRHGIASDNLPRQAAAWPQDESVAGHGSQPGSIQPEALLERVLERSSLQRALKQVRQNKGAPVCPNCHAMLHRGETVLSIEELVSKLGAAGG